MAHFFSSALLTNFAPAAGQGRQAGAGARLTQVVTRARRLWKVCGQPSAAAAPVPNLVTALTSTLTSTLRCRLQRWVLLGWWLAAGASAAASAPLPVTFETDARWQPWAQQGFQQLGTADGLPNDVSVAVAEDRDGFVWVGTLSGVTRWDGYQFRTYKFEPGVPGTLPDNLVQVMHRDAAGRLWVGTSTAGLARYNPGSDTFSTISAGPQGLSHVSVRALADDGRGGLWVGTEGGLDLVDATTLRVQHIRRGAESGGDHRADIPSARGLQGDRVVALLHDREGRLWAGTPAGLFRRDAGAASFQRVPLPLPAGAPANGPPVQPEKLMQDSAGDVWVGTVRRGAYRLRADGSAAQAVQETLVPAGAEPLSTMRVMAITEARAGEVWIGTLGQGIVAVDTATGHTHRLMNRLHAPGSLADNVVSSLYRDRAGLVWATTPNGLSRIDPGAASVLTLSLPANSTDGTSARVNFSALMTDRSGRLWLGTHANGVQIVDPANGHVQTLQADGRHPGSTLPPSVVGGLAQAQDGSVFIGTFSGLYRASADGRRVARVTWPGRQATEAVGMLLPDSQHPTQLWVAGLIDGLWSLDTTTGRARATLDKPAQRLTDRRITALAAAAGGGLWIGTRNGLNLFMPGRGVVQQIHAGADTTKGLASGFVSSLHLDKKRQLWIGTYGGGVQVLDTAAASPSLRLMTTAQGLPDSNINALLEDDAGQIWVSTDNGLAVINPATMTARALRRADGVVHQSYWTGAAARTAANEMLFGASGGRTLVRPALVKTGTHRPTVVLTHLRVGGRPVNVATLGARLQVPANANALTVEFSALDYSAPERNVYAHKLLGFDADWVPTDSKYRQASYNNLPPGDYTLQLRGSNRDGVFSERDLNLPIHVQAAWHQTLWFRAGATLALLLALYAVVQLRTRALRTRRRELQRLVDERTAELQATSAALSEKTRALEEKSRVLERASICDPLTGLHNRRFLTEHIETALAASLRRAQGVTPHPPASGGVLAQDSDTLFFLIDVDHFKRVNDEHGHAAGDTVLVQLALRLQAAMRESDYVVRWGGEEFLAVARDTDRHRADELAERIRSSVSDQPFLLEDGRELAVSCSIGHACWPFLPRHPHALDWLGVVNMADIGLLTAKRLGRNTWVGLHGTEQARPESLLARARAAPKETLQGGDLRVTSSGTPDAVNAALLPLQVH